MAIKGDMNRPSVVYIATNLINSKIYVGVTGKGRLGRRIYEHARDARLRVNKGKFYKAIRKYGIENFFFEAVEDHPSMTDALVAEMRIIADISPEYNSTLGGDGGRGGSLNLTEDGREKLRARHRGNKYRLGKTHSSETKEKLRKAAISNPIALKKFGHLGPKSCSKAVVCLNDGSTYESASAAARFHGLDKNTVIQVCQRHKRRVSAGRDLVFRYFGDHHGGPEEAAIILSRRRILSNGVKCENDGRVLSSLLQAAKAYGIPKTSLARHCSDGRPLKNGLQFKYVEVK